MNIAERSSYLSEITEILKKHWPENRTINIACHGHSVPAGYFATPMVDSLNAYPHLLYTKLKHRFPFAVINVIVTAIGGENSESGAKRFEKDVLSLRPDIITIDYGLNDRAIGLKNAEKSWSDMIVSGLASGAKILLLTPTTDITQAASYTGEDKAKLVEHASQIRRLAAKHETGLADSFTAFQNYSSKTDLSDILSWSNHPNRTGHNLVAQELLRWFPV